MILVTLGTQDKPFMRLLNVIQKGIDDGIIKEKVVVQAGCNKFDSKDMEIFDLIEREKFIDLIDKCDVMITHGGVGSIISGLNKNKKIIVCPRIAKYGEVLNDHQIQITKSFSKKGYIIPLYENDNLEDALNKVKKFKPKKFKSNTNNMIKLINKFIDNN